MRALAKLAPTSASYAPSLHRPEYYDPLATSSVSLGLIALLPGLAPFVEDDPGLWPAF
jgi:hypothetical protein